MSFYSKINLLSTKLSKQVPIITRRMSQDNKVRSTAASGSQVYESKRAVDEYLLFHYGRNEDIIPFQLPIDFALNFSTRGADLVKSSVNRNGGKLGRVLDIGCAVGGLSFALSEHFSEVVGLDYSQHFVDAANIMKSEGKMNFNVLKQGDIFFETEASIPSNVDRSKVTFLQGDACNLQHQLGTFDAIIGSNLLCRLPNPRKFLREVSTFLNPNGVLVLISPYSWLEEYTEKANWVGAVPGKESFNVLKETLEGGESPMSLTHRENVAFLIREHERKYQLGVSDATIWRKL